MTVREGSMTEAPFVAGGFSSSNQSPSHAIHEFVSSGALLESSFDKRSRLGRNATLPRSGTTPWPSETQMPGLKWELTKRPNLVRYSAALALQWASPPPRSGFRGAVLQFRQSHPQTVARLFTMRHWSANEIHRYWKRSSGRRCPFTRSSFPMTFAATYACQQQRSLVAWIERKSWRDRKNKPLEDQLNDIEALRACTAY